MVKSTEILFWFHFCAVRKQNKTKTLCHYQLGRRKGLFGSPFRVTVHHWEKSRQEFKAGLLDIPHSIISDQGTYSTAREIQKELLRLLAAGSQSILYWASFCTQFIHWLELLLPTVSWAVLHHLTVKTVPHRHAHGPLIQAIPQLRVFSQIVLAYVRLTI